MLRDDMAETLRVLGARDDTLSASDRAALSRDGFLLIPEVLDRGRVDDLKAKLERLSDPGSRDELLHGGQAETFFLDNLLNQDPIFDPLIFDARLLAANALVMGPWIRLSSVFSREPLAGGGHQGMHIDGINLDLERRHAEPAYRERFGDFLSCNSIWTLDDFTEENGPTRFVPGSHLRDPATMPEDTAAPFPDERHLIAPAGSLFIYNAHLWHGGTVNRCGGRRRMVGVSYVRGDQRPFDDQPVLIRQTTRERLGPAAIRLVGVD